MRARLPVLLLLAGAALAQEPRQPGAADPFQVHPDDPLHRFVELEIPLDGATIEWTSDFEGTLHVWARSQVGDPVLAVSVGGADAVADDDSGGGTTACIAVGVQDGQIVVIAARSVGRREGTTEVHWVASPENDETRAAIERAKELLGEVEVAQRDQEHERARALVAEVLDVLRGADGGAASIGIAQMASQTGAAAHRLGAFETCLEAWSALLVTYERALPEDHPYPLVFRRNVALTMKELGDLVGARTLEEGVVAAYERILPEDHSELLAARDRLATTMRQQGELAGARALQESVLAARERTLPQDHPDLLGIRLNLALTLKAAGDLKGAGALEEQVVAARERTLSEDHPELLGALQNLASTLAASGDLAGARALEERVLEVCQRALPEEHPHLQGIRQNLAATMFAQRDYSGALELLEQVLAAHERTLPADHPELLDALQGVSTTMRALGDLPGARALFERLLAARERTLPEDHPRLLDAQRQLAAVMREQGDYAGARALFERVVAACERSLPPDHPELLGTREGLALTMRLQGDLAGARALQERVLEIRVRTMPEHHPGVLTARLDLAITLKSQGDLAGARVLQERVLELCERVLPEDHPELIRVQHNLATTLLELGDVARARALLERVLAVRERTLPEDHPDLASVRGNVAGALFTAGDFAGARALQERVLAAFERVYPDDHPKLLAVRENLAALMVQQRDFAGARAIQERVLEVRGRALPEDHPDLLLIQISLASTLASQGDHAGARALEERVLEACERTLPEEHPHHVRVLGNLANRLRVQGDHARARALLERAVEIGRRGLRSSERELLMTRQNLAATMYEQGDVAGARAQALELMAASLSALELAASTYSQREARAFAGALARPHSAARFLSGSGQGARQRFELAETLRSVIGADTMGADDFPELDTLRKSIASVRQELGDLLAAVPADRDPDELARAIESLTRERDDLDRELRAESRKRGVLPGAIRASDVAAALPRGAVAVGFLRVEGWRREEERHVLRSRGDVLAAHLVRPSGEIVEVELGLAADLERAVETWRAQLGKPLDRGIGRVSESSSEREAGEALRARLLDPLLGELSDETTTLLVCAADLVHAVPLDALPLGDGRVGDRYRLVNLPSFRRLVAPRRSLVQADEPELLVVGGVDFDAVGAAPSAAVEAAAAAIGRGGSGPTFVPLPSSGLEAEFVQLRFGRLERGAASLLTGGRATKAAFHELAPGKRFVHVATHGWFSEIELDEPEEGELLGMRWGLDERVRAFTPLSYCGLAFAGANLGRDSLGRVPGIMTAEELAGVDLSACELAVLSACETNVGLRSAGMGIESLQSALHAAGARTAITSLWKVDDAATRKLMELFYAYLWVEKLPKAEALWKAKCDLRAARHPVQHWAAWVLSGDPE